MVLAVFLLIGGGILHFFGISLEVVRLAGSIVVFHSAWQMIGARPKLTERENQEAAYKTDHKEDICFLPMTVPLLAGSSALGSAFAVTLGLSAQAGHTLSMPTVLNFLAVLLAILLLGGIVYLCLRSSSWLLHWLGETGIKAASQFWDFLF